MDDVNPEQCLSVGLALQKELDRLTFIDKMRVKGEVTNLSQQKKTIELNDRKVVIDSMKLSIVSSSYPIGKQQQHNSYD